MKCRFFHAGAAALLAIGLMVSSAAAAPVTGTITEDFSTAVAGFTVIDNAGGGEVIKRFETGTNFAWGACGNGAVTTNAVAFIGGSTMLWKNGAMRNLGYAYTRFDTTTAVTGTCNVPSIILDCSAAGSKAQLVMATNTAAAPSAPDLPSYAILIRDNAGWWQSSAKVINVHTAGTTYDFDFHGGSAVTWTALTGTTDMDEVDNAGEAHYTAGAAGTPNFGAIEGLGIKCTAMPAVGTVETWFDQVVLIGAAGAPPATNVWTETLNSATIGTYDGATVAIPGSIMEHREPLASGAVAEIVDLGSPQNRVYRISGTPGGINALVTQNGISSNTWADYGTLGLGADVNFAAVGTTPANNVVVHRVIEGIVSNNIDAVGYELSGDTDDGYLFRVGVWVNAGAAATAYLTAAEGDATIAANKTYRVTTTFVSDGAGGTDATYQVANVTDGGNLVAPASGTIAAEVASGQLLNWYYGRQAQGFLGWVDNLVLDNTIPSGVNWTDHWERY